MHGGSKRHGLVRIERIALHVEGIVHGVLDRDVLHADGDEPRKPRRGMSRGHLHETVEVARVVAADRNQAGKAASALT